MSEENSEWGYYILPSSMFIMKDEREVSNGRYYWVRFQKSFVEDIDRFVTQPSYYLVEGGSEEKIDKRKLTGLLREDLVEYLAKKMHLPPNTTVSKQLKNGNVDLEYKPLKYLSFKLKLKKNEAEKHAKALEVPAPERLPKPKLDSPKPKKQSNEVVETFNVEGSRDSYTVEKMADNTWKCSCPHFTYRAGPKGQECKHIKEVKKKLPKK